METINIEAPNNLLENITKYKRNEYGLIESYAYSFNEDGSIRWRDMIKPEFLYVNKPWFEVRQKPVPTSTEGLTDKQLTIMLGGIKELAKLRGFTKVDYSIEKDSDNKYVSAKCDIIWMPNYETNYLPIDFSDCANASIENTDSFCHKFLETIACNRSFIRCVRNFLNIHIVGADEIDRSTDSPSESVSAGVDQTNDLAFLKPSGLLEKEALKAKLNSFEEFIAWLRTLYKSGVYQNNDAKDWGSYKDIPAKECRILTKLLANA